MDGTDNSIFGGDPSTGKGNSATSNGPEAREADHNTEGFDIEDTSEEAPIDGYSKAFEEDGIYYYVCSGNLTTSSPLLRRDIKKYGSWGEKRSGGDSLTRLSAEGWDENAFLLLMQIFHLCNRNVPRTVTLETLAKFAILVDYYECDEAVELFTSIWIEDLKKKSPVPQTYSRDLILWMWVSWVFKLPDHFRQATAVAMKKCTESVRTLGLPIPSRFTGKYYSGTSFGSY